MATERPGPELIAAHKIFTIENVPFGRDEVTLVSGYWDLLHSGHVQFLRRCKELGNPLVVGVLSKEISTKPERPVLTDEERLTVLSEMASVDYVFLDRHEYNQRLLDAIKPKVIVFSAGETASPQKQRQIDFLAQNFPDISVVYIPRQSYEISTTQIIRRIQEPRDGSSREVISRDQIGQALIDYAKRSNAPLKTAAFIVAAEDVVVSKGVNYHPESPGNVVFSNTDSMEYKQLSPRPTHAEIDAIIKLMTTGVKNLDGLTIYSLHLPCAGCAEVISRLGFKKVVYFEDFDNNYGELILRSRGVQLDKAEFPIQHSTFA